jgi:hypothetical protein
MPQDPGSLLTSFSSMQSTQNYPCACCGYLVLGEPPGSYSICPICYWEDDIVQLAYPLMRGGANKPSLCESQKSFEQIKVSEARFSCKVRSPNPGEQRGAGWRPIDLLRDPYLCWESSSDGAFWKKHGDRHRLYWWRPDYWLRQETPGWRFHCAIPESHNCQINGVSVWDHEWSEISGDMVIAKDPHGQLRRLPVYQISLGSKLAVFAAEEFSNGIFGFFVPAELRK